MARQQKRPSAEVRAQQEQDELYLKLHGWFKTPLGSWRHRNLESPWPMADAKRLTEETEDGGQDFAHRILRGREAS